MSAKSRWIVLILAVVGLGFASSSTWVHYKLLTDASYTVPCDISSTFNCSQAYLSPYGSVAGVPVAIAGMFWFGLVALIAAYATPRKDSAAGTYIFLLSTIGLAVILYLAFASYRMQTACILCLGTYAAVIGIFILSATSSSVPLTALPSRLAGDISGGFARPEVAALVLALVGAPVAMAVYFPKEGSTPKPVAVDQSEKGTQDFTTAWNAQPRVPLGIPSDGAAVVVVKFNDYQCPGCRQTHEWYKPILAKFAAEHPGKVKYVLKDWPWHSRCNFNSGTTMHPGACEGAAAVRMARDISKAKEEEMENWLWANQQTMSPDTVKAAVKTILGVDDFESEYAKKLPDIHKDIADGGALRIGTTPTLFINGVRIEDLMPPQYFELAIQIELNKAGK